MSPRISPAELPFSDEVQDQLDRIMPEGVPPLTLFTMLARDQRLCLRFMAGSLLDKGNLSLRQREIVIDRTTARCGSEYEWGVHITFFGKKAGIDDTQQYSLVHGDGADPCWQDEERLLIEMCDVLNKNCDIPDELWHALQQHFSDAALLEIVMLCGQYRMVSYLTNIARLDLEPGAARFPSAG